MLKLRRFFVRHLDSWDEVYANEQARLRTNSILLYAIIAFITLIMSILNAIAGINTLLLITSVLCIIFSSFFLLLFNRKPVLAFCTWFSFAIGLFISANFIYSGGTEGFSTIWLCALPLLSFFIAPQKTARLFNLILLLMVLAAFYTPLYNFLDYDYTTAFRYRFPVVLIFIILCAQMADLMRYQTQKRLIYINEKMAEHALTDALTGVGNRYAFEQDLTQKEYAATLAYALIDIDFFKKINDNYGHAIGDEVLKHLAQLLSNNLRPLDRVYRWGGEEFLIVLPRVDFSAFENTLQRLRATVEQTDFSPEEDTSIHLSISIGGVSGHDSLSVNECISYADKCLYKAKKTGRNRVVASDLAREANPQNFDNIGQ